MAHDAIAKQPRWNPPADYELQENVTGGSSTKNDHYEGGGSSTLLLEVQYGAGGGLTDYSLTASDTLDRDMTGAEVVSGVTYAVMADVTISTTHSESLGSGGEIDVTNSVHTGGYSNVSHAASGYSQTTSYNGTNTTNSTTDEPQIGATLAGYSNLAGLSFARAFQEVYEINPTQAPWPLGLGFGLVHEGDITGPLLAPNGGSNGLDPFYATRAEHQQTLNTGGPMAGGNFGEGGGGSGSGGSMGGYIPTTFTTDSVQHAPPEKAAPPDCDCHCGDEEGTHYLDQTSDMVGEVHGDTVTRGSKTRSLEDVQEWDDLNPNLTPEGWDEFFALGENAGWPGRR
ncbi:MAG: hypothetical protein AB7U20_16085 [Planctomycetaceae bacterium]